MKTAEYYADELTKKLEWFNRKRVSLSDFSEIVNTLNIFSEEQVKHAMAQAQGYAVDEENNPCFCYRCRIHKSLTIALEALKKIKDTAIMRTDDQKLTTEDYKAIWFKDCEFAKEALDRIAKMRQI